MGSPYYKSLKHKSLYIVVSVVIVAAFLLLSLSFLKKQNPNVNLIDNIPESATQTNNTIDDTLDEGNIVAPISPDSIESTDMDNNLELLLEDDVIRETQRFEAMERVPVDPAKNDLIDNMKNESIKESMLNLANFDDDMLASSTINGGDFAERKAKLVTRLMRVRKLYSIGLENPDLIIPDLRNLFQDSLKKWPEAFKKLMEDSENGIGRSEPASYDRVRYYCLAATYLLAEFGDYESLPILSYQYRIHNMSSPPIQGPPVAPVYPAITFYAMHRLASSYPRESLSKEAFKALDEYLAAAKELVPEPKEIEVTVWGATYIESDPRLSILDIKNEVLEGQELMTMPLYPTKYLDGTKIQGANGNKFKKTNDLFEKLDAFVQIAYPPDENPVP